MPSTQTQENMPPLKEDDPEYSQQRVYNERIFDGSNVKSAFPPTTSLNKDIKRIRRYLEELQRHRAQVLEVISPPRVTNLATTIEAQFDRIEISYSLGAAMDFLALKQIYHAEKQVHHALKIADHLDNELSLARCFYWLGRIDFQRRNLAAAHAHFRAARLCVLDAGNPESGDVRFYLEASRPKPSKNHHGHSEREPSNQAPSTHSGETSQGIPHASNTGSRRKRKREPSTWDLPIRPSG